MYFKVTKSPIIAAELTVPGDKSISHRSIMLGALTNGTCVITNFLEGEDCLATMKAMQKLGVQIEHPEPGTVIVHGCRGKFTAPASDLDCGNSGTTVRLLSGILAAQPFRTRMTGDASLSSRPMRRVIEPLTQMGGRLKAEGARDTLPLVIEGGPLTGMRYEMPHASAQVKSAVLLAGLFAKGTTTVVEPAPSRDHTERMLEHFLVRTIRNGNEITIHGGQKLESRDFRVPGDISSAAFWLVAAAAQPGSRLLIDGVGLNPTRSGIIDVLVSMGARVKEVVETDVKTGEPSGAIEVEGRKLNGITIEGDVIANIIDEIPAIAIAAALANGKTTIRGAKELRVKETDRIAAISKNLRAMGVHVKEFDDGMEITGGGKLKGATMTSHGDHRIAMSFAIAGLFAEGETIIEDVECVATSYPTFEQTLKLVRTGKAVPRKSASERGTLRASVERNRHGLKA
jgi:3-phosphoshikimate 1-carboxyvinyltransferase